MIGGLKCVSCEPKALVPGYDQVALGSVTTCSYVGSNSVTFACS